MTTSIQHTDTSRKTIENPNLGKRIIKNILYIIMLIIDVVGLALTTMGVAWILLGESNLFTWHFSSLLPGLIALSPIFVLLGLLSRKRWLLFHIFPTVLFVLLYGVQFIPRSPIVGINNNQAIRVMTFNTKYRVEEASDIVNIILEADVDVIALQELSSPTAEYFAEHLIDEYPYQIAYTWGTSVRGKGLLSRYPLTNEQFETFNGVNYLRAQISFADETITLVNTHPQPPHYGIAFNTDHRSRAIDSILERLATESDAVIVLGDFNTTDQSADYRKLTAKFTDSFREVGFGLGQTFPDFSTGNLLELLPPMIRIDYVFHSEHLQSISAEVWHSSAGSDHRPLVASLALRGENN
jgi:endonuclease/exonuclease/phosphatase (EEP) superfamily protein YafD